MNLFTILGTTSEIVIIICSTNPIKEHFNRMFNIKDKTDQRKEMLYQNSVQGQVNSLNERMNAMNQGNRINRMNNFRNGFK